METQSVSKGAAILSAAGIFVKLLSILYVPILVSIIGEDWNGTYQATYTVYVLIYAITNIGIPTAISKLVSELFAVKRYDDAIRSFKIARSLLLIVGFIMTLLLIVFAKPISIYIGFKGSYLAILALAPSLLLSSFASAYRGYFQGIGNMKPTAISQVLEQICNAVFTVVLAALFLHYGSEAACAGGAMGTTLGALVSAGYLLFYYLKHEKTKVQILWSLENEKKSKQKELLKKVVKYSFPITLCISFPYLGNMIDMINIKGKLLESGFSDSIANKLYSRLGIYQQLLNAPIAISAALAVAVLPAISAAVAMKDQELVQNRNDFVFRICLLIMLPFAAGFSALSKPIYDLFKYPAGWDLLMYGSIALVGLAIVQIQTSILQGSGKLYTVTFNLILGMGGRIITNLLLIPIAIINVKGAIIGSLVSYTISISLNSIIIRKVLGIRVSLFKLSQKPLFASLMMGVFVYLCHMLMVVLLEFLQIRYVINVIATFTSIAAGSIFYFVFMIFINGINKKDLAVIPLRLQRVIPAHIMKFIR